MIGVGGSGGNWVYIPFQEAFNTSEVDCLRMGKAKLWWTYMGRSGAKRLPTDTNLGTTIPTAKHG